MTNSTARSPLSRGWRLVLTLSLAVNLLVIGLGAGAFLRHMGNGPPPPPQERRMSFGELNAGLEREDYRALRESFDAAGLNFKTALAAEHADRQALLAALRAKPFDEEAFRAAADRITVRGVERTQIGNQLIRDLVISMPEARRQGYADRLEEAIKRSVPRPRPEPKAQN